MYALIVKVDGCIYISESFENTTEPDSKTGTVTNMIRWYDHVLGKKAEDRYNPENRPMHDYYPPVMSYKHYLLRLADHSLVFFTPHQMRTAIVVKAKVENISNIVQGLQTGVVS